VHNRVLQGIPFHPFGDLHMRFSKHLLAAALMAAAVTVFADEPTSFSGVGTDTMRDFFAAHIGAPVTVTTSHQAQHGVLSGVGPDHFCVKGGNQVSCTPFSQLVYYGFNGKEVTLSFEHPY